MRYNFGPTAHDKLAQAAGNFTYHFDTEHHIWQTLGAEETGASAFVVSPETKITLDPGVPKVAEELCRAGIESEQPILLRVRPIMGGATLPAGNYRLRLLLLDAVSTTPGQRVFTVSIRNRTDIPELEGPMANSMTLPGPLPESDRVDIFQETGQTSQVLERSFQVVVGSSGEIVATLTPVHGKALVCAMILEPVPL